MFGIILAAFGCVILYLVTLPDQKQERRHVVWTIQGAYVLRLVLQNFLRDIPFFSSGYGGDWDTYAYLGQLASAVWTHSGFHYMTDDELPGMGSTTLPANVFGVVIYLNDGELTRLGCTAVVAIAACLTCHNLYRLALELGANEKFAFKVMVLTLFGPAFLMYTSDTYKDAFVALFTTAAVASAMRLAHRFSLWQASVALLCMVALWQVRFYMVFFSLASLVVGLTGVRSRTVWRPFVTALALVAVAIIAMNYTDILGSASERASQTFTTATNETVRNENAQGGSGVTFDDGGNPFGTFGPKVAYMLFSPFPWQPGSLGFQIGKLDVFIWYFLAYRAFRAGRRLARDRPTLLFMFLAFVAPVVVAYSATMSNIGLIVRQRIPMMLVCALLATLSEPAAAPEEAQEDAGDPSIDPEGSALSGVRA